MWLSSMARPVNARSGSSSTGDYFGEMGLLLSTGNRTATIRTRTPVSLLGIAPSDFDSLLTYYPQLAVHLLRQMAERLFATQEAIIGDLITANHELQATVAQLQAALVSQDGRPELNEAPASSSSEPAA